VILTTESDLTLASGRLLAESGNAFITPALDANRTPVENIHLLIEAADQGFDEDDYIDDDLTIASRPALSTESDEMVDSHSTELSFDYVIDNSKLSEEAGDLVVYVGVTEEAMRQASKKHTDGGERDNPINMIEAQTDQTIFMFRMAGIGVNYQPIVEVTTFQPQADPNKNDFLSLKNLVISLTDNQGKGELLFRSRREEVGADIGILIVHRESETDCGHARGINVKREYSYAVVNWKCLSNVYTLQHEIGHLLGAFHDRTLKPYEPLSSRAYVNSKLPSPFVTIMGLKKACGKIPIGENKIRGYCSRKAVFSRSGFTKNGKKIGTEHHNNAASIRSGLMRIAGSPSGEIFEEILENIDESGDIGNLIVRSTFRDVDAYDIATRTITLRQLADAILPTSSFAANAVIHCAIELVEAKDRILHRPLIKQFLKTHPNLSVEEQLSQLEHSVFYKQLENALPEIVDFSLEDINSSLSDYTTPKIFNATRRGSLNQSRGTQSANESNTENFKLSVCAIDLFEQN
jgi:hypothetical protein